MLRLAFPEFFCKWEPHVRCLHMMVKHCRLQAINTEFYTGEMETPASLKVMPCAVVLSKEYKTKTGNGMKR